MKKNTHFFLAVPIPNQAKEYLNGLSIRLKEQLDFKVWTYKDDYHITLTFLGHADDGQLSRITSDLINIGQTITPFNLKLDRIGYFGKKDQPRVVWAGIQKQPSLDLCHKHVSTICARYGFHHDERTYRPHITIGKKWSGNNKASMDSLISDIGTLSPYEWKVDSIILYKIMLNDYPKYQPVHCFYL